MNPSPFDQNAQQPPQPPPQFMPPPKQGMDSTKIILILFGIAFVVFCILPICCIVILALLGPAIGNTFSDINSDLFIYPYYLLLLKTPSLARIAVR